MKIANNLFNISFIWGFGVLGLDSGRNLHGAWGEMAAQVNTLDRDQ
jgi:hypothetical protein